MAAVYGTPGGRLQDAEWAQNRGAAVTGRTGELQCAERLAALPDTIAVIHDLRIPIPGINANIDHLVVAGNDVTLIDTKLVKAGRYSTKNGEIRRGREIVEGLTTKTLIMGRNRFRTALPAAAVLVEPIMAMFPAGPGRFNVDKVRCDNARVMDPDQLDEWIASTALAQPANSNIVDTIVGRYL